MARIEGKMVMDASEIRFILRAAVKAKFNIDLEDRDVWVGVNHPGAPANQIVAIFHLNRVDLTGI